MKKLFIAIAILFSLTVKAQTLDTVYVRHLSIKARDWGFFMSYLENDTPKDSTSYSRLRKINAQLKAASNGGWNQVLTVDSIPGAWVVKMYRIIRNLPQGLADQLDPTTKTNILAKTQVTVWLNDIDCCWPDIYINRRNIGKSYSLDN
jgi:hypothetical protein